MAQLLDAGSLPYLNPDDANRLAYGFQTGVTIPGSPHTNDFVGTIWLLIDEDTSSQSELFAIAAQQEGIMTA